MIRISRTISQIALCVCEISFIGLLIKLQMEHQSIFGQTHCNIIKKKIKLQQMQHILNQKSM